MRVTENQPTNGKVVIPYCIAIMHFGLVNEVPTIYASVDPDGKFGRKVSFVVKEVGDYVNTVHVQRYVVTLIAKDKSYLIFEDNSEPMPAPKSALEGIRS